MNIFDLLAPTFHERASEVAIEYGAESVTFAELEQRAAALGVELAGRGLVAGDRLAVNLANGLDFVTLYLACVREGFVFVPVNVLYRDREVARIVADAEPAALVTRESGRENLGAACWSPSGLLAAARAHTRPGRRPPLDGSTPAAIVYTSGTTGTPKGAVLTHDNFVANTVNLLACWRITAADRLLLALPLFHVHGLGNGLHCALAAGCRVRLLERFEHQRIVDEFLACRPTLFFGVPTMYARLMETPAETAHQIGRQARLFVSGSAALSVALFESFRERFGHAILERYGMSETLMTLGNPYGGERRPGTVGIPFPGTAIRIVDAGGSEVAAGVDAELEVRGPTVFPGYWRNPEATSAAFRDGWFRTGDVASRSSDGYVTLVGRMSDLVICSGFNVYPREVEDVLVESGLVREAAVIARPDALRGEVPVAFYVPIDGIVADEEALDAWCRDRLASFKVPRAYVRVDSLPRNAMGKVQKQRLALP